METFKFGLILSACHYDYQTLCHLKLIDEAVASLSMALNGDQDYKTFLSLPLSSVHGGILHRGKALVSKLYSSVQALGGTSHFTGTSVFQLTPSVQYTNYEFSHKHCLEAHHKKLLGSDLYPCILYVLYSAHHAAVTFDDCSRLKLGQKNSDFSEAVCCNKCHVLCGYTKTWSLHIWATV